MVLFQVGCVFLVLSFAGPLCPAIYFFKQGKHGWFVIRVTIQSPQAEGDPCAGSPPGDAGPAALPCPAPGVPEAWEEGVLVWRGWGLCPSHI